VFDAWILPIRVVDPSKNVPDLNCEVRIRSRGSGSQIKGAGYEIRRDPPNLTPVGKQGQLPTPSKVVHEIITNSLISFCSCKARGHNLMYDATGVVGLKVAYME